MVWSLTKTPKFSTLFQWASQNAGLATNQYLKILDPSLGRDLQKTCNGFYQYPKYRSHSRETSQNASNFHNFSKHRTSSTDLTTDPKGICTFSRQHIVDAQILPGLRIERYIEKISRYKITTLYDEHFRITRNFNHKKHLYVCYPKILPHHGFCYDKLTSFYVPSFLSVFSFFFLFPRDSPFANIAVIFINMYN